MHDDDREELIYLASSAEDRLKRFRSWLAGGDQLSGQALIGIIDSMLPQFEAVRQGTDKKSMYETLHSLYGIMGSILASTDWQSPTFMHAVSPQAGSQAGRIHGTYNDYKRDHHLDAEAFEQAFVYAYIDAPMRMPPKAYVTSSGMSAFATVLVTLIHEGKANGPILAGASSYFENKGLLMKTFGDRMHWFDENNAEAIIEAVKRLKPSVIFIDSLCNTDTVAMADLKRLIPALAKCIDQETHLVLDNSGLGPMYQPLQDLPMVNWKLRLTVIESLNKFYQFGLDRVTGGIIWTDALSTLGYFGERMHLGTNMPDASVLSIPEPNRILLERRMSRIGRNIRTIAERLQVYVDENPACPIEQVVYPGLKNHPTNTWTKELPFHGGFCVLGFKPEFKKVGVYKKFLDHAINEAGKAGIDLHAGTSFGFNTTRVYLTALHATKVTTPFIRISAGTETEEEIDTLCRVFVRALESPS